MLLWRRERKDKTNELACLKTTTTTILFHTALNDTGCGILYRDYIKVFCNATLVEIKLYDCTMLVWDLNCRLMMIWIQEIELFVFIFMMFVRESKMPLLRHYAWLSIITITGPKFEISTPHNSLLWRFVNKAIHPWSTRGNEYVTTRMVYSHHRVYLHMNLYLAMINRVLLTALLASCSKNEWEYNWIRFSIWLWH